jgi:peptidoglycan L-alanyl-D-glutamate endopeptidase CwlK
MPRFGSSSKKNLSEAHPDLVRLFEEVIKHYDCSVIEGHRPQSEQDAAYHSGKSKVQWPNSKHNSTPSMALDVVPYPIDWNDTKRFYYFGGFVKGVAAKLGLDIRWGGDWDSDNDFKDQSFHDLPHFELRSVSSGGTAKPGTEYLPSGPSEDDIDVTLEDIERSTLG